MSLQDCPTEICTEILSCLVPLDGIIPFSKCCIAFHRKSSLIIKTYLKKQGQSFSPQEQIALLGTNWGRLAGIKSVVYIQQSHEHFQSLFWNRVKYDFWLWPFILHLARKLEHLDFCLRESMKQDCFAETYFVGGKLGHLSLFMTDGRSKRISTSLDFYISRFNCHFLRGTSTLHKCMISSCDLSLQEHFLLAHQLWQDYSAQERNKLEISTFRWHVYPTYHTKNRNYFNQKMSKVREQYLAQYPLYAFVKDSGRYITFDYFANTLQQAQQRSDLPYCAASHTILENLDLICTSKIKQ